MMTNQECCRCHGTDKLRTIRDVTLVFEESNNTTTYPLPFNLVSEIVICMRCIDEVRDACLEAFNNTTGLP